MNLQMLMQLFQGLGLGRQQQPNTNMRGKSGMSANQMPTNQGVSLQAMQPSRGFTPPQWMSSPQAFTGQMPSGILQALGSPSPGAAPGMVAGLGGGGQTNAGLMSNSPFGPASVGNSPLSRQLLAYQNGPITPQYLQTLQSMNGGAQNGR